LFNLHYKQNRIYGLDIFRAIAILTVVIGHGLVILKTVFPATSRVVLPNGVEMFFVLSGFLIGQLIFKKLGNGNFSSWNDLVRFWKFRWFRTLPNYYLILAIDVLLAFFHINNQNVQNFSWKFLFFIQNFAWSFRGFFPESWSLSVEEWFYLLFPAALILLLHFGKQFSLKWRSLAIVLLFIAVPLTLKFLHAYEVPDMDKFTWGQEIRKVVIYRLDSIIIGVLFAWFKHFYGAKFSNWRYMLFFIGLVINVINRSFFVDLSPFYFQSAYLVVNGIAMAMLIPFFDGIKSGSGFFYRTFTYISIISYAMYVVHFSIVLSILLRWVDFDTMPNALLAYASYWLVTIVLSHVIYKYYEKPMTDLREKV